MGATAVARRVRRPAARARASARTLDEPRARLVAVIGLAGGAGTTTLALALARHVAADHALPVLLTERAASAAGLAVLTGRASQEPLARLARNLAEGDVPAEPFIELAPRLRLIASMPSVEPPAPVAGLDVLLNQARDAHGLVIVDCGTDHLAARPLLERATNVVWTVPATPAGLAGGRALFSSDVLPPPGQAREVLAAVASLGRRRVRPRALRLLAQARCERVVLVPHSAALVEGVIDDGVARALTGVCSTLRSAR